MKNNREYNQKFNIVFDGTVEDLVSELETAGFDIKTVPSLDGNSDTLIIEKTPTHKMLDELEG